MKAYFITSPVGERWRLTLALMLALGLHAMAILGLDYPILATPPPEPAQTLNVTLLGQEGSKPDTAAVREPYAVAPVEQSMLQTPEPPVAVEPPADAAESSIAAESPPDEAEPALGIAELRLAQPEPVESKPPISPKPAKPSTPSETSAPPTLSAAALMSSGLQMARLEATPRPLAERTREKRLNLKAMTTGESFYFEAWRRKVEQVGELNFPEEAKRRQTMLGPTLDVALHADGSLHSIALVRSSGNQALDAAARRIVELAAPFAPFPEELRRQYDILHIVRTWEFKQSGQLVGK